jgi:hypothetical protein
MMRRGEAYERLGKIECRRLKDTPRPSRFSRVGQGRKLSDPMALKSAYERVSSAFSLLGKTSAPRTSTTGPSRSIDAEVSLIVIYPARGPGAAAANAPGRIAK